MVVKGDDIRVDVLACICTPRRGLCRSEGIFMHERFAILD